MHSRLDSKSCLLVLRLAGCWPAHCVHAWWQSQRPSNNTKLFWLSQHFDAVFPAAAGAAPTAARDPSGSSLGYKLGDFGLATLRSGHWRVTEGDSRWVGGKGQGKGGQVVQVAAPHST